MVEIEHIQDIEKDQPAKSSAKEQKLKDPKDVTTETQDTDASEATEHDEKMKKAGMLDWKDMLIINWSDTEKNIVKQYIQKVEENKTKQSTASIIEAIRKDFSNSTVTAKFKTAA